MLWKTPKKGLIKQSRWRLPLVEEDVLIQILKRRGGYQILATAENARPLWTLDRLTTAESDKVCSFSYETFQVLNWRNLCSSINQYKNVWVMSNFRDITESRSWFGIGDIKYTSCLLGDSISNFPGFGIPNSSSAVAVREAHLNHFNSHRSNSMIIKVSLTPHHNDLIPHPRSIRQPIHFGRIKSSNTCSRSQ